MITFTVHKKLYLCVETDEIKICNCIFELHTEKIKFPNRCIVWSRSLVK